jgi:broad specificity phosphatase PhoE
VVDARRVVCSPLRRARETAAALGLPVTVDERWVELDYGELDGRPITDVPADLWTRWRADVDFAPPGGESLAALGVRVRAACEELAAEAAEADVVVVSHVSPIKAAVAWALGVGDELSWRLHVAPASVTRIAVRDGRGVLTAFNWTVPG